MHRDRRDDSGLAGMERRLGSKAFVARLRDRGLAPDAAAEVVCQVFGVSRVAARLYLRSHPSWASDRCQSRSEPGGTRPEFKGGRSCWSRTS